MLLAWSLVLGLGPVLPARAVDGMIEVADGEPDDASSSASDQDTGQYRTTQSAREGDTDLATPERGPRGAAAAEPRSTLPAVTSEPTLGAFVATWATSAVVLGLTLSLAPGVYLVSSLAVQPGADAPSPSASPLMTSVNLIAPVGAVATAIAGGWLVNLVGDASGGTTGTGWTLLATGSMPFVVGGVALLLVVPMTFVAYPLLPLVFGDQTNPWASVPVGFALAGTVGFVGASLVPPIVYRLTAVSPQE